MKEGYLKGHEHSTNTRHLSTSKGEPLCSDTTYVCGCWQHGLGPVEAASGLTKCYKSMLLHYFYLLVLIHRHTENKANQLPKISEDGSHVCHPLKRCPLTAEDRQEVTTGL